MRLKGLLLFVMAFAASGASCPLRRAPVAEPVPAVLPPEPTMGQIIDVVNRNRLAVHSLYSNQATLSGGGFPRLRASLAVGGPRTMRLQAGTGLTGGELDVGSNEELFWFWMRRGDPPTVYFARHHEFQASSAHAAMPVDPQWLVEALGLVYLEPAGQHEGPYRTPEGHWQINTIVHSPVTGERIRKVTIVHAAAGWVLQQQIYDGREQLLARAIAGRHVRDPQSGAILPRQIDVHWPPAALTIRLELDDLTVNPANLSPGLWTKPEYPGYANVDLGRGGLAAPASRRP